MCKKIDISNISGDWNHLKKNRIYRSDIPGKHEIRDLQKQPYWTLHTLFGKYKTLSGAK
jgi:hypothetical protein